MHSRHYIVCRVESVPGRGCTSRCSGPQRDHHPSLPEPSGSSLPGLGVSPNSSGSGFPVPPSPPDDIFEIRMFSIRCKFIMARALLLWFVLWMTLPTSVRAVQDFRSQDQDSLQACRKIEDSLADAYDHENWAAATRTANLLYECPIERGKVHVWKLRALYRGGEHRTVLEEVNAIRSEFDDEQTPPYPQAGEVLYYGFLSAYAIGEDEIALQMVNDSWRFKDLLSDASKAEIASSRIAAALKLGEYAYALDLVDSMEGHFASVSPFQKAQYWQAEALAVSTAPSTAPPATGSTTTRRASVPSLPRLVAGTSRPPTRSASCTSTPLKLHC